MSRKEAIDALVKAVEKMDYGTVLSFSEIGGIIRKKYGSSGFTDILQAARKRLIVSGHMIENVRGIGYKVSDPDDYTNETLRRIRIGTRSIDVGMRISDHAPVNDMSPAARESHNLVNDKMRQLQAALAGKSVEIHMLGTKKNPLLAAK